MFKMKIGIVGIGVLGKAIESYYKRERLDKLLGPYYDDEVFCYDKHKNIGSIVGINKADMIFICVPTPRGKNNECDVSIVDEAISYLVDKKIVVIKSTVAPFTTDTLQIKYPQHQLIFNPEFLTERHSYIDFYEPKIQIVGYTNKSKKIASEVLEILPQARFFKIMPAAAAEMFKYVRNCYLASKNVFFNQIYDLCLTAGIDYKFIKVCAEADPWIGPEHLDPNLDGFRGFNGKCLPKDTEAFLTWAGKNKVNLSLLKEVVEFNSAILKSQKIKKDS